MSAIDPTLSVEMPADAAVLQQNLPPVSQAFPQGPPNPPMQTLQPHHADAYRALPAPPQMYAPPYHPGMQYAPPQPAPRQRTAIACRYCRRRKVCIRELDLVVGNADPVLDPLLRLRALRGWTLLQLSTLLTRMHFHSRLCSNSSIRASTYRLGTQRSCTTRPTAVRRIRSAAARSGQSVVSATTASAAWAVPSTTTGLHAATDVSTTATTSSTADANSHGWPEASDG